MRVPLRFEVRDALLVRRVAQADERVMCAQEFLRQIDLKNPAAFSTAGFMHLRMHLDHVFGRGVEFTDLQDTRSFSDVQNRFAGLSDHVPIVAGFQV